jgi:hypothetical protein
MIMNRACFFKNTTELASSTQLNLHEPKQHASCIPPLKNNSVRMKNFILISFFLVFLHSGIWAQHAKDSAQIVETALNYIEGWYTGDTLRMDKALHPDLIKRRYDVSKNTLGNLTKPMMMEFTRAGYGKKTPADKIKNEIKILDIYSDIASAKAESYDFVDYMQLIRVNGQWKILNVLWDRKVLK